jgi:hypothetical protein
MKTDVQLHAYETQISGLESQLASSTTTRGAAQRDVAALQVGAALRHGTLSLSCTVLA